MSVLRLSRSPGPGTVTWDPARGRIDPGALVGVGAAVHLASATIDGRWTAAKRRAIRDSRVGGTRLLAGALAELEPRPRVLVSISASGIYGDRGDEPLDESSPPGTGFLAETVRDWEAAADPARAAGIRVVHPRLGLVFSRHGGGLPRLALPFRLGLGGRLGSGRQWMPWIARADVVGLVLAALGDERYRGAVNGVAPETVTNATLTRALGRALHRPAWLFAPAPLLRLALGGFADEALLASARMRPARLEALGFRFRHPALEPFLIAELR